MSAHPWNQGARGSAETDLRAVAPQPTAESRLQGPGCSANGRDSPGMSAECPDGAQSSRPIPHPYTEKYLAAGFSTTTALVDCSGCNWNSSDREIPIRSAPSIARIGS
jgi:hypothetical protein